MPDVVVVTVTLLCGFLAGVLAAILGVGGAVITTPVIRFLGATPLSAVGSTVPAILPGALTGAQRYHRAGLVDVTAARVVAIAGVSFAILGALASEVVDARWLMVVTAALVIWSGFTLLRPRPTTTTAAATTTKRPTATTGPDSPPATCTTNAAAPTPTPPTATLVGLGVCAGFLAGILGIGGGLVLTPGLSVFGKMPVKRAIATSLAAVGAMSIAALATHVATGHIDWRFALPLAVGIVPGARLGSRFTLNANEDTLRTVCGIAMAVLGAIYLARELADFF